MAERSRTGGAEFYRQLFSAAPDAFYVHDDEGRILEVNEAAARQTGIDAKTLTTLTIFDIAIDVDGELTRARWSALAANPGETLVIDSHHRRKDGFVFPVEIRVTALPDQPTPLFLALVRDASSRQDFQNQLRYRLNFEALLVQVSTRLIQSPMKNLDDEITNALGMMGEFFSIDRAYLFLFSDDGSTMSNTHEWVAPEIERHADELQDIPMDTFPVLIRELQQDRVFHVPRVADLPEEAGKEREEFERENIQSILIVPVMRRHRLVGFVGFDAVGQEVHWPEETILGLRHIAQTIISVLESRILSTRLTRLAFHDPLTGLPNRKLLHEQLKRTLARGNRAGRQLAILMMDLDDFKQVNDRFGHTAGDRFLCEIAERLRGLVEEPNLIARLGGDEFVILLPQARPGQARQMATAVLDALKAEIVIGKEKIRTSSSIGIVEANAADSPVEHLLRYADMAMYAAKGDGKSCFRVFEPEEMQLGRGRSQ